MWNGQVVGTTETYESSMNSLSSIINRNAFNVQADQLILALCLRYWCRYILIRAGHGHIYHPEVTVSPSNP